MNVLDAAYHLVQDYPGGAASLAPRIGKGASTLSHWVHPNYSGCKLGLADAVRISVVANDPRILNAFALEMHCMVLPLVGNAGGDRRALEALGAMAREFGDVVTEVSTAVADGQVSDNEMSRVEQQAGELMLALQGVLGVLRQNNQAARSAATSPL